MSAPDPRFAAIDGVESLVAGLAPFLSTEYASLTRGGAPVTWPVTPYLGVDGRTLDISSGLTYPLKAERARRDPRVALCFSHPAGSGYDRPPIVAVQGLATVRDADLVANSARYLAESRRKLPEVAARTPRWVAARMDWYWCRMWVAITPVRALWWERGDLTRSPRLWTAPTGTSAPPSDPAPRGPIPGSWRSGGTPLDWRRRTRGVDERLGLPTVTVVDGSGAPFALPTLSSRAVDDGFLVDLPVGVDVSDGPAALTFHTHGATFDGQENVSLVGRCVVDGERHGSQRVHVVVDRALTDWGVPRSRLGAAVSMASAGRRLRPRLRAEASRRGCAVPTLADLEAAMRSLPLATDPTGDRR
jgi:hypothetical protein